MCVPHRNRGTEKFILKYLKWLHLLKHAFRDWLINTTANPKNHWDSFLKAFANLGFRCQLAHLGHRMLLPLLVLGFSELGVSAMYTCYGQAAIRDTWRNFHFWAGASVAWYGIGASHGAPHDLLVAASPQVQGLPVPFPCAAHQRAGGHHAWPQGWSCCTTSFTHELALNKQTCDWLRPQGWHRSPVLSSSTAATTGLPGGWYQFQAFFPQTFPFQVKAAKGPFPSPLVKLGIWHQARPGIHVCPSLWERCQQHDHFPHTRP